MTGTFLSAEKSAAFAASIPISGKTSGPSRKSGIKPAALNMSTAVINDNRLYGFSHYGRGNGCIDTTNGKILERPGAHRDNVTFCPSPAMLALIDDESCRCSRPMVPKRKYWPSIRLPTTQHGRLLCFSDQLLIRIEFDLVRFSDTKKNSQALLNENQLESPLFAIAAALAWRLR